MYKVESKFDTGQFLQTLFCVRMNNQQGQGLAPSVINTVNRYTNDNALDIRKKNKDKENLIKKRKDDDKDLDKYINNNPLNISP